MTDSLSNFSGSILVGGTTEIPWHEHLQSLEVSLLPGGAWTATLSLFDPNIDEIERRIIEAGKDRFIDFEFGRDDANQSQRRSFSGYMLQYQPEFMPHGTMVNLEIVARPAGAMLLGARGDGLPTQRILSFPEGRRASEIVQAIADQYGWATVDSNGRATIEPTEPPLESPFNTIGETPLKFIRDQILKQAQSASGGASAYIAFFDEVGAFHFRTPDFIPPTSHLYRFARDINGEVVSFSPQDTAIFGVIHGGGNTRFMSAASFEGGTAEQTSTATGGVSGEGAPAVQDASAKVDFGTGTHSVVHLNVRDPAELERTARARHETFRRHAFQANLVVHGTHRVRMTDYIRFEFPKENGELHYLSGNFQVFGIQHKLGVGEDWHTTFTMQRAAIGNLPGTTPLLVSQTINPSTAPPPDGSVGLVVET